MAKTLTCTATASLKFNYVNSDTISSPFDASTLQNQTTYENGRGNNQANVMYRNPFTVTSESPNSDFNLFATLSDKWGDTFNAEYVKALIIRNLSTTSGDDIHVGPLGVSNGWTGPWGGDANGKNKVGPSGAIYFDNPLDGYNVETDDRVLRIQYQGTSGSISVQIGIIACSGDLESSSSSSSSSSVALSSSSSSSLSSSSSSSSVAFSSSSSSVGVSSSSSSSSSVAVSSSSSSSSVAVSSSSSYSSSSQSSLSSTSSELESHSSSSVAFSSSSSSVAVSSSSSSSSVQVSSSSSSLVFSSSSSSSSSSTSSISSQG